MGNTVLRHVWYHIGRYIFCPIGSVHSFTTHVVEFLAQIQRQQLCARNTLLNNRPCASPLAIILRRRNLDENRKILSSSTQISRKLLLQIKISKKTY